MSENLPVSVPETALVLSEALPLTRHPAAVYLVSLSDSSRRTMRQALNTIAQLVSGGQVDALGLNWSALRYQHTTAIRSRLAEMYAPATANKMLSALRGVLKAAWLLDQVDAESYHKAVSIENVKGSSLPTGRDITAGELAALMDACIADWSPVGVRDAAIIGVLYTCGVRRSELVHLDVTDYDADVGSLHVRDGKRGKDRLVYPQNGAALALADWLELRGDEPGPLFVTIRKGGFVEERRMTTQAVWKRVQYRARQAGVKDLTPHDFRRTFVGDLLDAGADIATVAKLAGHSNVQTTMRYDRRPEETKRRAAGLLHLPYRRRNR